MIVGKKARSSLIVGYVVLSIGSFMSLLPIFWMIVTSFKNRIDAFAIPPVVFFQPTLVNYYQAFIKRQFLHFLSNSLLIASSSTLFAVGISFLPAYTLARFKFKGSKNLSFFVLSLRIFPPIVVLIPYFLMMARVGLIDTHLSLVLIYTMFNTSFAIWMLQGFFKDIPVEIEEAAMIDGASMLQVMTRIVFRLSLPGTLATSVFCFIFSWNEFLLALTLTRTSAKTLPVGAAAFITGRGIMWGEVMAVGTLASVPVIILLLIVQKQFVRGLTFGAIR